MNLKVRSMQLTMCVAAAAMTASALAQSSTSFTGFATGVTVDGQGGWGASNPAWDELVIDDGSGNIVWRASNAVTSGSFGDMPYAPRPGGIPLDTVTNPDNSNPSNFAGESSTGAANNRFVSTMRFRSATGAAQPGMFMSLSPDNGSGGRVAYVGLEDTGLGINVITYDINPIDGDFIGPISLTTVDYTSWHDLRIEIDFADGMSNDVVKVYVDNVLEHTGDTWEDYYTFNQPALHPLGVPAQTMLFRLGGTAVPANSGGGYYFDDVVVSLEYVPLADLELTPTDSCVEGGTLTVNLDLTRVTSPEQVVGGQFFLHYDPSVLSFVSAVPGSAPFTVQVYENVNTMAGNIDYAVGVPGGGPGTDVPTTMAVLTFNVLQNVCSTSNLVTFRTPPSPFPPTRVTNAMGADLSVGTTDLPSIRLDGTAPSLTIPSSVTLHADAGVCTASASSVEAAVLSTLPAGWGFGGDAAVVNDGGDYALRMDSDTDAPLYSFMSYNPSMPFLFSALNNLNANYKNLAGCFGGGGPRFSVRVDADNTGTVSPGDKNIFVYWGTVPSFNDCPPIGVWQSTGNLAIAMDARFDLSQLAGPFYGTRTQADALAGTMLVLRVSLVSDGGWTGNQSMLVDDVQVNSSTVSFLTTPSASDNCTASPTIVGVRSDMLALNAPYPTGTTTITWTATDECGNQTSQNQTVTVLGTNLVDVAVQLESAAAGPFTRCITFEFTNAPGGCPGPAEIVEEVMTFTGGLATATIEVDCGSYNCITARDRLHTLRRTDNAFHISGASYVADFTGSEQLIGGNLNDDYVIDILDFGGFVGQFGTSPGASTTCGTAYPHADINGNGGVGSEDYTFIQIHFFNFNELDCCASYSTAPDDSDGGLFSVTHAELRKMGQSDLIPADLNNDGTLDTADIQWFLEHGTHTCAADFDRDTVRTTADIFSFLSAWFAMDLRSDMNGNEAVEVSDIFAYLSLWFAGCN